ncbi:hypothetical protein D3C71_1294330 [compost metagenome]
MKRPLGWPWRRAQSAAARSVSPGAALPLVLVSWPMRNHAGASMACSRASRPAWATCSLLAARVSWRPSAWRALACRLDARNASTCMRSRDARRPATSAAARNRNTVITPWRALIAKVKRGAMKKKL